MMSWLIVFRDEYFNAHPALYVLIMLAVAGWIMYYVYKHEARSAEEHRKDNYRPFK